MAGIRDRSAGVMDLIEARGGLRAGVSGEVHRETGVPEAEVYGVGSFYHLIRHPDAGTWVCQGLSCKIAGCDRVKAEIEARGERASFSPCLGRCDMAPATWCPGVEPEAMDTGLTPSSDALAIDLSGREAARYRALERALEQGPDRVIAQLEASGLQGRGGAGFPAHIKWRGVRDQPVSPRYVVLNADEGEPGTFKDREVMRRRPHLVIEGLAIAAWTLGAGEIHLYVRGEFSAVKARLQQALAEARARGDLDPIGEVAWRFTDGHGAYICGEETALLEALEGRRGMPRMKPPFPVEVGLFGRPTLIQNVETVACIPSILLRGGAWFRSLGRDEPGTKLYSISGHVARPGVYEAPLGLTLKELAGMAGGITGKLQGFSPGGASSGFLPASDIDLPLDFGHLRDRGSMLGSAGVVVLDDTVDMSLAALTQMIFFEGESCGQCSPCRIGTQLLRQSLERHRASNGARTGRTTEGHALHHVTEISWGMSEASICGLGQSAALPLTSAMKYFPEQFGVPGAPGTGTGGGT